MSKKKQGPIKSGTTDASPEQDNKRRRLLKTLTTGSVAGAMLPSSWSKPVIDTIVMPAHAQPSSGQVTGGGGGGGVASGPGPAPAGQSVLDFFISPASAGVTPTHYCIEINVQHIGGVPTSVTVTKVCWNSCKSGTKFWNKNVSPIPLVGSGTNWNSEGATVAGFYLALSEVNPLSATLAHSDYNGVPGTIINGDTCDCTCGV